MSYTAFTPRLKLPQGGADYSRFIGSDTAKKLLTPLLRQLNFWCESGISE